MKVIIWGCGEIGKRIYKPLRDYHDVKVLAYTDSMEIHGKGLYTMRREYLQKIFASSSMIMC